jgi:replicative DNA helicase
MNDQKPTNPLRDAMEDVLDDLEDIGESQGYTWNAQPTGIRDLDTRLGGGLRRGALTVIASRPGMGRTTLLSDIVRHTVMARSEAAAVWTLEESRDDFTLRWLSAEARVALHHMRAGAMTHDEWERLAKRVPDVAAAPLYISAPASLTAAELSAQAATLVTEHKIRLLAIDGIQDIRPEKRSDLREREVGDVVRDLKTLARELDIPVLATSHLNRGPEGRIGHRPQLDDLRESGAVTYAADLIVFLHREDYYELESPRAGEADLYIAKHRHGPTGRITIAYQAHYGRFVDLPPDYVSEQPTPPTFDPASLFTPKSEG